MDFGTLLHVAKQNSSHDKKAEAKYYPAKFSPPKKECKEKKLSANIQKFLAKKEEEEKEKLRQAKQQRDELLSKRDVKAKNKIQKMLKVIKSANKSVLDDAIDNVNTAITLQGPEQPDEDDYGYVSQEASAFYRQIMDKYKSMPEENKFQRGERKSLSKEQIASTKNRVKAAINKEIEDEKLPRPRQSHSRQESTTHYESNKDIPQRKEFQEVPVPIKEKVKRLPPPPALDFQELLKIAAQKQHEPIEVEIDVKKKPERLMTTKERRELEEKKAYFDAKQKRQDMKTVTKNRLDNDKNVSKENENNKMPKIPINGRIPKLNNSSDKPKSSNESSIQTNSKIIKNNNTHIVKYQNSINNNNTCLNKNDKSSLNIGKEKNISKQINNSNDKKPLKIESNVKCLSKGDKNEKSNLTKIRPSTNIKGNIGNSTDNIRGSANLNNQSKGKILDKDIRKTNVSNKTIIKPSTSKDVNNKMTILDKKGSVETIKKKSLPDDYNPVKYIPMKKPMKKPPVKRRIDDDDSEYDSEMDDFIDDGPEGGDYSKYIKEIFGYDKSRYRDENFDDKTMESSFSQQMREEYISKKIGIMEDLEDMRLEAMEKKNKTSKKKVKRLKDD